MYIHTLHVEYRLNSSVDKALIAKPSRNSSLSPHRLSSFNFISLISASIGWYEMAMGFV